MKVAFISRDTLYTGKGGDTVQVLKTAHYLREKGVQVDVFISSDKIDYSKYDILHGFNVIRPADLLKHFKNFKKIKVLSTIYVDYWEYETKARGGKLALLFSLIGRNNTEYLKTCVRWIKNGERNFNLRYLLLGHRQAVKKLVNSSTMLLPNSESEYRRLSSDYSVQSNFRVIPNAIDPLIFKPTFNINNKQNNLVISVAKIDGRKNQLNLIRALNNSPFELIIIGKNAPNHAAYYDQCKREAAKNITFITEIEQEELVAYYLRAKVHAMPSWFETTGLSSLEAIAMGCNIVITNKGDTLDYFGSNAEYCEPDDTESILDAVKRASLKNIDNAFRNKVYSEYIWEQTAIKTLAAYHDCLNTQN